MQGEKVRLRTQTAEDFLRENLWYADPELQALDPSVGPIINSQMFSIETLEGKHIGVCGLYNVGPYDAQLGVRIGDKSYWSKGYGADAIRVLVNYGFDVLGVGHIWLKVLPTNTRAIRCYEKSGFIRYGKLAIGVYEFITMEIRR